MIDIARLERILSRRTVAPDRETLVTRAAHLGQAMRSITTYYPELWNGVDRDPLRSPWTWAALVVCALLSLAVSDPFVAVASGTAFLVSELADMAVYTPLRRRHWIAAVFASNVVGTVVDSALFLMLAFGSLDFLAGNVVSKSYMTVMAVLVLWMVRRRAVSVAVVG